MARSTNIGACIALAVVIAAGSADMVCAQLGCCISACGSPPALLAPRCSSVDMGSCHEFCLTTCGSGCILDKETDCPTGQTAVSCSTDGQCLPTCATFTPTATPWGLIAASLILASIAGLALQRRMRSR